MMASRLPLEPSGPLQLGKGLIIAGVVLALAGLLLVLGSKFSFFGLGRLPGDLAFKGKNFSFYFPIVTSLLVSVALTLLFWLVNWITRK